MPELREVYEMTTKQIEPEVDAWREQEGRQRKANNNRKLGAFAVAAGIVVAAIALILALRPGEDATTPGSVSTADPAAQEVAAAREVATGFADAYGTFDAEEAIGYLADGAYTTGWLGGNPEDLRMNLSWWEAIGYKQILDSCEVTGNSAAIGITFHCTFDYHAFGSDELGLGPFSGSYFDLTVRDGQIVQGDAVCEIEDFSPAMWEPFGVWVSKAHPKDAAVMYTDDTHAEQRFTEESFGLWEQHIREYVKEVQRAEGQ